MAAAIDLPLRVATPDGWARQALARPLALLNDHAHLERKAATNALELLHRWPEPNPPENWVRAMTAIARDEVEHLAVVCKILARRGGRLTKSHHNAYASALRDLVRAGRGPEELLDRLIVAALIEARSCERFEILSRVCPDPELAKLYRELWSSEHGHYLVFLDLAGGVADAAAVAARWEQMLDSEATIIRRQPPGPRMHTWPAPEGALAAAPAG
jgi:tRNA-(ms[2]io[6]A)-hydroxylase